MERLIHIQAKSKIFSVDEFIQEDKAEQRLVDIRDGFLKIKYRHEGEHELKVNTTVVNSEIPAK